MRSTGSRSPSPPQHDRTIVVVCRSELRGSSAGASSVLEVLVVPVTGPQPPGLGKLNIFFSASPFSAVEQGARSDGRRPRGRHSGGRSTSFRARRPASRTPWNPDSIWIDEKTGWPPRAMQNWSSHGTSGQSVQLPVVKVLQVGAMKTVKLKKPWLAKFVCARPGPSRREYSNLSVLAGPATDV